MRDFSKLAAGNMDGALDTNMNLGPNELAALQLIAITGLAQSLARLADAVESIDATLAQMNPTIGRSQ